MVAVFMPGLKLTLAAASPDHQSQADLPALIHDVSAIFVGGLRLRMMFDSTRRPGSSPTMITRQGVLIGASAWTAIEGLSRRGDNSARTPNGSPDLRRYMPE